MRNSHSGWLLKSQVSRATLSGSNQSKKAAPFLAKDDDAGFMNRIAVTLNPPPKKPPPDRPDKKDSNGI